MSLAELFPDGDYRFHLTLRRTEPRAFFASRDANGTLLAERVRWLAADPERYAAMHPEGEPLRREFAALASNWIGSGAAEGGIDQPIDADAPIATLGGLFEPDLLFLSRDGDGEFRLRGGALCFPTGWALEEKIGHTLDAIHGVVPGLNPALGASIQQFLSRLKPGVAYLRDNWGIAATAELNLHPARGIAAPDVPFDPTKLWLRVEHQALMHLPETRGILFGIRIAIHRLDTVYADPAGPGFRRAIATMPAELAAYKRIGRIRSHLLNWE
jgi:hypothetical protein